MATEPSFTAEPKSLAATTVYKFKLPKDKVFEAMTNRELIKKWWLEDEGLVVEEMDVRDGGSWRFVQDTPQGPFIFRGVYHRVDAPNQIVTTWGFEATKAVFLETITFEDMPDGKTKVTDQFVFQSQADRQMMLTTGMERGTIPMFERLEKLL